jgi:hypothetical protein
MRFDNMKSNMESKTGLVREKYSLKFNGMVLETSIRLLSSFGLKEGCTVDVVLVDEGKEGVLRQVNPRLEK